MSHLASCPELALCDAVRPAVGWDRVAVSVVVDAERRLPLAGSDLALQRFSNFQQTLVQGPCLDALRCGAPVLVDDLRSTGAPWQLLLSTTAERFPVRSTASLPLLGSGPVGTPVGVLTVGRDAVAPFTSAQVDVLTRLADVLAGIILVRGSRGDLLADVSTDDLPVLVGMLRARLALDEAEALARLRAYAFAAGRTIHEVATDAVAGLLDLEEVGLHR
ncbi:GAF domain-containing protein [Quadrisphaera granulorum]|uniref:GAF domain-containing protein n=1 Tax=Quadrisphaera granulorum TaxID=317664 RepID=A0A316A457_9ACTN|nr:GAF and ANTAR domain-containing protein [Quadrisphaera granulorum]PWJ52671.1 GAF domain-containing protein [Quadrisphaera granulorum]SZE97493.1 GAF domain-containing protein [Quadrisphaera granulorum]